MKTILIREFLPYALGLILGMIGSSIFKIDTWPIQLTLGLVIILGAGIIESRHLSISPPIWLCLGAGFYLFASGSVTVWGTKLDLWGLFWGTISFIVMELTQRYQNKSV